MAAVLLEGAEPLSVVGGPQTVVVIHGFTGTPNSLRPLAKAFAAAGFSVELPLLPGHGTRAVDMEPMRFHHWTEFLDDLLTEVVAGTTSVVLAGLSMGGTLACWLAEHHPEVVGLILINPLMEGTSKENMAALHTELAEGHTMFSSIGSDIAMPDRSGGGYYVTPIRPLLSLLEGAGEVASRLGDIVAPVLLFSSRVDHVVPPTSGDVVAEHVSGPVERVYLENSFHVATLDYDAPELEERAVAFARKAVAR